MSTKIKKPFQTAAKQVYHYTAEYIINPPHPVTINLVGCGGTGSQVLNSLARMNSALRAIGHPGIFVRAIDPDKVTDANMGRQLFSPSDVDSHKCIVLVGRVNRFFGLTWEAIPSLFNKDIPPANITISCVDSAKARREIKALLKVKKDVKKVATTYGGYYDRTVVQPYNKIYYWMDFGNMMDRGQVVIGTLAKIKQPVNSEYTCLDSLPTIEKLHPDILKDDKKNEQGPSCSLAEALHKQDLFINTNLANMGLGILWKMFRELRIKIHGCYLNLETMNVNPIKIK